MEVVYATFKAHKARSTKPSSSKEVDAAILLNNHVLDMSMSYRKSRRAEAIPPEAPPLLSAEAAPRHLHGSALTRSPPGTPSASTPLRKKGTCSRRCTLHLRTGAPPSRNGPGSRRRPAPAVETPCSKCSETGFAATASKFEGDQEHSTQQCRQRGTERYLRWKTCPTADKKVQHWAEDFPKRRKAQVARYSPRRTMAPRASPK